MSDRLVALYAGDCLDALRRMPDASVDAVVTDPPYGLAFMGKKWDYDVPPVEVWAECLRVLKPGGHLLAFAGTRTQHRMAVRIEDAGFEIRDMIAWVYGSGFPKSLDVSKAIDKAAGAEREVVGSYTVGGTAAKGKHKGRAAAASDEGSAIGCVKKLDITAPATDAARQWEGWGTALKPAMEPITVARKPLIGTVAENVLTHGTGAINVDGCRVATNGEVIHAPQSDPTKRSGVVGTDLGITRADLEAFQAAQRESVERANTIGRWPANLIHDGSDEVVAGFPVTASGSRKPARTGRRGGCGFGMFDDAKSAAAVGTWPADSGGSAARFFYCAKASQADRDEGNKHPTVKPTALMRYLVRLVTPPGGTVLDPYMGSGSTGKAAVLEGFGFIGCEKDADYLAIARARIASTPAQGRLL